MDWHAAVITIGDDMRLRRWREDDADALLLHANDEAVGRGLSDRFPYPYTRTDAEAFLSGKVVDLDDPVFAIEIDGQACGAIGARRLAGERRVGAELGYWIGQRHWGQGRMSRIVGAYVPWVMGALDLHRLQATVLDFNQASARVLLKNGFAEEGCMRRAVLKHGKVHDLRLFAITRDLPA